VAIDHHHSEIFTVTSSRDIAMEAFVGMINVVLHIATVLTAHENTGTCHTKVATTNAHARGYEA
jgi:hypothetical protein